MQQNTVLISISTLQQANGLNDALCEVGYNCRQTDTIEGLQALLTSEAPVALICDLALFADDLAGGLSEIRQQSAQLPIVLLGDRPSDDVYASASLDGLTEYLEAPFLNSEIIGLVESLKASNSRQGDQPIAQDPYSRQVMRMAKQVAPSSVSVLISGESGVGKEVVARYIHDNSDRTKQPFVAINCAAIPDNMLEASLFGYEKGAFTGAYKSHAGKFEQAQHGTLLLDEISEMPLALQAKLLRVLQEREVERIGGQKIINLDVRIIATTNRNLQAEVAEGRFRKDLYYRLNIFPIHWVPLRERPLDILPLAQYLLVHNATRMQRAVPTITDGAKQALMQHTWPGNAREMDNVMQRALILQPTDTITVQDIQVDELTPEFDEMEAVHVQPTHYASAQTAPTESVNKPQGLKQQEQTLILQTLKQCAGNRTVAAQQLNISTRTLRYKLARMREQGIDVPRPERRNDYRAPGGES